MHVPTLKVLMIATVRDKWWLLVSQTHSVVTEKKEKVVLREISKATEPLMINSTLTNQACKANRLQTSTP